MYIILYNAEGGQGAGPHIMTIIPQSSPQSSPHHPTMIPNDDGLMMSIKNLNANHSQNHFDFLNANEGRLFFQFARG